MNKTYMRSIPADNLQQWVDLGWKPLCPDFDRKGFYKIEWRGKSEPPMLEDAS